MLNQTFLGISLFPAITKTGAAVMLRVVGMPHACTINYNVMINTVVPMYAGFRRFGRNGCDQVACETSF